MDESVAVGRGTVSLFGAGLVQLVANTLYYVILTNLLHSTLEVGVVTSLNILIWFFVLICVFAEPIVYGSPIPAPLAVLKFVPEFLAKNDRNGAAKVFRASLMATMLVGLVVAGFLAALPYLVIPLLGGQAVLPEFVRLSAIDILVLSVSQICLGVVVALGDTQSGALYIIIWSFVRYTLASILLVPHGIPGILVGWILGDLVLLLLALQKTMRRLGGQVGASSFSAKDLARYSLYTLFATVMGFVINQADRLITLSEQGLSRLAIYNTAMVAASIASSAPYALINVLLPVVVALFASNRMNDLHAIIRSYSRYVSIFVMPIAFGLAAVMEIPLRVFGPDYVAGLLPAVIGSVATGLTALGTIYAGVLLALGKLRWYTAANLLGLVALLVVAVTLTPVLGLSGPALGRASLMAVSAIIFAWATYKTGIFEIDFRAYVITIVCSTIMMLVVFGLQSVFHSFLVKILMLPVIVIIGLLVYIGSLRVFRLLTVSDIDFIRDLMPDRMRVILPIVSRVVGLQYDRSKGNDL